MNNKILQEQLEIIQEQGNTSKTRKYFRNKEILQEQLEILHEQ